MNFVTGFLDALEKLVYRILMWVILFPKTLLKIALEPQWVPGYIKEQLLPIQKNPFSDYVSPITFFVVIALAPLFFLPYLPKYGAKLSNIGVYDDHSADFIGEISFKLHSNSLPHGTRWFIRSSERYDPTTFRTVIIHEESHSTSSAPPESNPFYSLSVFDSSLQDYFYFNFGSLAPGTYTVEFEGGYFKEGSDVPIESYTADMGVFVPDDPQAPLVIQEPYYWMEVDNDAGQPEESPSLWKEFQQWVQSGKTYQLVFSLLALPLAFAVISRGLRKQNLGEESLRAGFYIQCYLLSPVLAAYWATKYAGVFTTPDIFFSDPNLYQNQYENFMIWFPFALMVVWFFFVEIGMIARERGIGKFGAFLVLLQYLFILFVLFWLWFGTGRYYFRKATIFGYVLLVVMLVLFSGFKALQRIWKEARAKKNQ